MNARQKALQDERAAIQSHSTSVISAAWDGPGQMAKATGAPQLKHMCAWYLGSEPDQKQSYKFPHHAAGTDTPANINGVNNAKARLPGSSIPSSDKSGVEAHLNRHQRDWQDSQAKSLTDEGREYRKSIKMDRARIVYAPAEFRYATVEFEGKEFFELTGYATTWNQNYLMYDMFGTFMEKVASDALDSSLTKGPDVAFLVNHKGVTMARTTNKRLEIYKDLHGLGMRALLNPSRQDVTDLMAAVKDKDVTEMSWAFMLEDGEWNDDFTEFTITQADINRGDVSAVNYGANPYTNIWARAQQWAHDAEDMPETVKRDVLERIAPTVEGVQFMLTTREAIHEDDGESSESQTRTEAKENEEGKEPLSRSVALYRNKLMLENED